MASLLLLGAGRKGWFEDEPHKLCVFASKREINMKDFFDILVSLPTPLIRGTRAVLAGGLGREVTYVAWMVVLIQALTAISHSAGIVSGVLLFAALMVMTSVAALTAFMSAGGNEYEPNKANVKGKIAVLLTMMFNATLLGTIVAAILVGLVALVSSVNQAGSLIFTAALEAAVCAVLVNYLLRRNEK